MKVMVCLKQVPHQDARLEVRADGNNGRANLTCSRDGDEFELIMDDRGRLTNIQGNMRGQA